MEQPGYSNALGPEREEQLDILVTILENSLEADEWILDLGYGSGKIEKLIFQRIPQAKIVGVDNTDFPVLLDEHLKWLREIGFEAACLHSHGNRILIVGIKPF